MKIKIGELAKMTDCQVVTIRYYEKEGLLNEPDRSMGNYRLYGEKDIERLKFIRHCRKHGMKLSEIRNLLTYRDNPKTDCVWINDLIEEHINNLEQQIESLLHLKASLKDLQSKCSGGSTADSCQILKSLADEKLCGYCQIPLCDRDKKPDSTHKTDKAH